MTIGLELTMRSGLAMAAALALATLTTATGCVGSGKYKQAMAERDSLAEHNTTLERKLEENQQSAEELAAALAEKESDAAEMKGTYDSLVDELEGELATGKIQIDQLANGIMLNLSDEILFPSGSSQLDEGGINVIGRVAGQVSEGPYVIAVSGHTDNVPITGTLKARYTTNWELAANRATSVVRLLQENGVEGTRLQATSHGPFAPVASNDNDQGRSQNRRIEIRLLPLTPGGEIAPVPAAPTP